MLAVFCAGMVFTFLAGIQVRCELSVVVVRGFLLAVWLVGVSVWYVFLVLGWCLRLEDMGF